MLAPIPGCFSAGDASRGLSDRMAEWTIESRSNPRLYSSLIRNAAADLRGVDDHQRRDFVSHRMGGRGGDDSGFVPLAAGHFFVASGVELRLRVSLPAALVAVLIARQD